MIDVALAPIDLRFARVRPRPERSVLVLSRQPGFDEAKSDAELVTLIRSRLNVSPAVAEATKNLDITLK
ncbi:MAG TPA: hypothetical protein VGX96_19120 [Candidatus Elarobacter sp.]|nr:hypothetical protein [Candidatus Elarobacter sp.]